MQRGVTNIVRSFLPVLADDMTPEEKKREAARLDYELLVTDAIERLKNQLELGKALIQSLTFANGGAIVALFTLIGQQGDNMMIDPPMLKEAFGRFLVGLVLAIAAGFGGFVSQFFFQMASHIQAWKSQAEMLDAEPYAKDHLPHIKRGNIALILCILSAAASLGCFAAGGWSALSGALHARSTTMSAG